MGSHFNFNRKYREAHFLKRERKGNHDIDDGSKIVRHGVKASYGPTEA